MDGALAVTVNLDLNAIAQRTLAARPAAIHEGLLHVASVSGQQVPYESGDLLGSQRVTPVEEIEDEGEIGYHTVYARYQHEKLDLEHPHGNAKYLERPMLEEAEQTKKIVAKGIGDAI